MVSQGFLPVLLHPHHLAEQQHQQYTSRGGPSHIEHIEQASRAPRPTPNVSLLSIWPRKSSTTTRPACHEVSAASLPKVAASTSKVHRRTRLLRNLLRYLHERSHIFAQTPLAAAGRQASGRRVATLGFGSPPEAP
jgi:hypothetical protein